jgi:hypothetical protein
LLLDDAPTGFPGSTSGSSKPIALIRSSPQPARDWILKTKMNAERSDYRQPDD